MKLANTNNIEKIFRTTLALQSQVPMDFVRNSLSLYGAMLDQNSEFDVFTSITPNQTLILFELINRQGDGDMSETNVDGSVSVYCSFTVHVIIYGDDARNRANYLVGRLRTARVREDLLANGIYLEKVSLPEGINEYKNGTMWIRNDFDIDISCELNFAQVSSDYIVNGYSDIIVQTIEEAEDLEESV